MNEGSFAFFGDFQKAIEKGNEKLFDESLKLFCAELQSFDSLPESTFLGLLQTFSLPQFPSRSFSFKLPRELPKFVTLMTEKQKKHFLEFIEKQGAVVKNGSLFHFYLNFVRAMENEPWAVYLSLILKRECFVREEIQKSVFSSGNQSDFEWSMFEYEKLVLFYQSSGLIDEQVEYFMDVFQSPEFLKLESRSRFFMFLDLEIHEDILSEKQQLTCAPVFESMFLKLEDGVDLISCGEFICNVYKDERAVEALERLKNQGGKLARIFVADTLVYFVRTYANAEMKATAEAILMAMKNDPDGDVKGEVDYALARLEN